MVQSVTRALRILNEVGTYSDGVGVREVSRNLDMKAPTVHALMKTLLAMDYLFFNTETRRYAVGDGVRRLLKFTNEKISFNDICQKVMNELVDTYNETVLIARMTQDSNACPVVTVVCSVSSNNHLMVQQKEGVVVDGHHLAVGKVLLAYQNTADMSAYIDGYHLRNSSADTHSSADQKIEADRLTEELSQIRQAAYAEAIDVANSGIDACAVPIFDSQQNCQLAIGCSAPLARMTSAKRTKILGSLFELAAKFSEEYYGQHNACTEMNNNE